MERKTEGLDHPPPPPEALSCLSSKPLRGSKLLQRVRAHSTKVRAKAVSLARLPLEVSVSPSVERKEPVF